MSLLTQASLILTPTAEKAGKLYSVVPSNGNGDMDVVRNTTATRVNSLGLIENVPVNEPRLNYEAGSPSILIEPQRTNLALRSEEFNDVTWQKFNTTINPNAVISPSGTLTADKLIPSATASVNKYVYQTPTVSNGINHSITVFAKSAEYNRLRIEQGNNSKGAWFNLSNGTIISVNTLTTATIEALQNGWYRCSVTTTSVATNVFFLIAGSSSESYQIGDGTSGIYIWGAQLEQGAYPTSYIPTLGSAQTRNADGISDTSISPLIGQTEGTFFIDFQNKANEVTTGVVVRMLYSITDGTANNRFSHAIVRTATRNYTDITIRSNNVTVSNINVDTPTGRFKIAVSYKIGATKMFINGVLVGNVGLSEIPIINRLFLGCSSTSGGENANVSINNFLTVKTALTDAECISLTTL